MTSDKKQKKKKDKYIDVLPLCKALGRVSLEVGFDEDLAQRM